MRVGGVVVNVEDEVNEVVDVRVVVVEPATQSYSRWRDDEALEEGLGGRTR